MLLVYGKPDCKWCDIAKGYLIEKYIDYENINLKDKKNREARKFLSDLNVKNIPIIRDGDYIFSEYSTYDKNMFLKDLKDWLIKRGLLNDW